MEGKREKARGLGVGAALATLSLVASYGALGIASIAVSRIVGPDATGLLALSNQVILITVFVAGIGLRTSLAAMIGAGEWSVRTGVERVLPAALALGVAGGGVGLLLYELLKDSALEGYSFPMAAALMASLPAGLLWWILPAIALGRERYEAYALLTISAPAGVMLLCTLGAIVGGSSGVVYGLSGAYVLGGAGCAVWALVVASRPSPSRKEPGLSHALSTGIRSWVNDLFQVVNLRPDLFILNAYATTADAGIYAVALSITSAGFILPQSLATVVLPRSAALHRRAPEEGLQVGEKTAASAVRHAVLVSFAAAVGLGVFLLAVPAIWGGDFSRTTEYGLIMLPGVALLGIGRVMVAAFTGRGHRRQALAVGMVSFPATLVAYLLVVPDHGTLGAALVSSGSYVLAALLAGLLFFSTMRASVRQTLVPTRADAADYRRFAARLRS
ncbi:MAG: lipopolysaccharide biosynthesis protein [Solirubrobacterales bacterium]